MAAGTGPHAFLDRAVGRPYLNQDIRLPVTTDAHGSDGLRISDVHAAVYCGFLSRSALRHIADHLNLIESFQYIRATPGTPTFVVIADGRMADAGCRRDSVRSTPSGTQEKRVEPAKIRRGWRARYRSRRAQREPAPSADKPGSTRFSGVRRRSRGDTRVRCAPAGGLTQPHGQASIRPVVSVPVARFGVVPHM